MSQEYPAVLTYEYPDFPAWMLHFGGLPSNTYTTMKLHSSPNLVRNIGLKMDVYNNEHYQLPKTLAFSSQLFTPISLFTGHTYVNFHGNKDDTFLFSFAGKYCIGSNRYYICCWPES